MKGIVAVTMDSVQHSVRSTFTDANNDGAVNTADAVQLLAYLFRAGLPPLP